MLPVLLLACLFPVSGVSIASRGGYAQNFLFLDDTLVRQGGYSWGASTELSLTETLSASAGFGVHRFSPVLLKDLSILRGYRSTSLDLAGRWELLSWEQFSGGLMFLVSGQYGEYEYIEHVFFFTQFGAAPYMELTVPGLEALSLRVTVPLSVMHRRDLPAIYQAVCTVSLMFSKREHP